MHFATIAAYEHSRSHSTHQTSDFLHFYFLYFYIFTFLPCYCDFLFSVFHCFQLYSKYVVFSNWLVGWLVGWWVGMGIDRLTHTSRPQRHSATHSSLVRPSVCLPHACLSVCSIVRLGRLGVRSFVRTPNTHHVTTNKSTNSNVLLVLCAVCCVLCAVCCVLCAVCCVCVCVCCLGLRV